MDANNLGFAQNQADDMDHFIKQIHSGNVGNLAIIEIENFSGIGIVYGIKAIIEMTRNFAFQARNFCDENYEIYALGFGVFSITTNLEVSLDSFIEKISAFKDFFIKHEFPINKKVKISLDLYIGISSKYTLNGVLKYRFDVLKEAFCALLDTKNSHQHLIVYDKTQTSLRDIQENIKITRLVYLAFSEDTLIPYFQPILDVNTGKIFKYETLIRIHTNKNEIFYPKDFLQVLKKTTIYSHAIKQVIKKSINMAISKKIDITINLGAIDIEFTDIGEWLLEEIQKNKLGKKITIEITEQEGGKNFSSLAKYFNKVRESGSQIALDDFGCGYSNLEMLMHIPLNFIKIDGSFIIDIDTNSYKAQIVSGIVNFAKALNIQTIAEFVSTKQIYDKVKDLGVDYVQGYFIGKPVRFDEIC
ncbi:hypothetical protein BKH42_04345 [Helicobacter sp. 13S00482-2]|uniref:EAL domain-containing protein n=1 Tax=Helicobacter sp. 13S00482-2 TaxID=1476200 RepID=UPI000BA51C1F|nr:EAL domain-containing protein [Helicobacter sp. 13S00482-2]PAF53733.1 hypothetical protein BKH42_04345 [Helicobacter sp. 13S00482-2]